MSLIIRDIDKAPHFPVVVRTPKPRRYKIIFEQEFSPMSSLNFVILGDVFRQNFVTAARTLWKAAKTGECILLEGTTREIAETKVEKANEQREQYEHHTPLMKAVRFTFKQMP